ncbi:DUF4276 family protein [Ruminococcus sp.]|uniref:DUF4276 family protein n=1 Tax=Ruminococcus sp. TaxID=41978 RepID=UPI00388EC634
MHFHLLLEDESGKRLVQIIMEKLKVQNPDFTYQCNGFHGIGGYVKRGKADEMKTGKLLDDLGKFLKVLNKKYQDYPSAVFIVLDNDRHDPELFLTELNDYVKEYQLSIDYVFCLAIEEMEAWLLGDKEALATAYPSFNGQVYKQYQQDSICGTWEMLANVVYKGGASKLKKSSASYYDIGALKIEWAENIGQYMDIDNNESPSFNSFISEIKKRLSAA